LPTTKPTNERFDSRIEDIVNVQKALTEIDISQCMNIGFNVEKAGAPMLCVDGKAYVDAEDSHTIIFGSTGSKKTRVMIMPTVRMLALANETMIIVDPKAELYDRTAADLQDRGYEIYAINFRDPSYGNAWNPLYIPYMFYRSGARDRAYEFVNDIVTNIVKDSISTKEPFWDLSAADLLFGFILILFDRCANNKPKDFYRNSANPSDELFSDEDVNISEVIKLRNRLFKDNYLENSSYWRGEKEKASLISASMMGTMTAPSEKTQSSILCTFDQKMRIFLLQDNLTQMLSTNDISFDSFGESGKKQVVYIIMPDEKTTYHKLISLFIKQSYEYFIYKAQMLSTRSHSTRINYLLDEFASLPAINDFPAMIAAARSRNIRFNIVIQSQSQLKKKYEEDAETIKANCNNWIFLTSRELTLLNELDELCGRLNESNRVFSKSRMQHFEKARNHSEALLLCGRLYPFLTRLDDINIYDGYDDAHSSRNLPMQFRETKVEQTYIDDLFEEDRVEESLDAEPSKKDENDVHPYDVQKELERKFDELFGAFEDEQEEKKEEKTDKTPAKKQRKK